jgi:transcriptional regulator with XRE-family HTH domain
VAKPSEKYSGHADLVLIGKAIRAYRKEKGISQEQLADDAGIDRSYLGGIERGEHNFAIITLIKISTALNIKAHKLIEM